MDTLELNYLLHRILSNVENINVIPCDGLSNMTHNNFAYIVNSDPSSKPGTHWLALYQNPKDKSIEFFDSFGMSFEYYGVNFTEFIMNCNRNVKISNRHIQSLHGTTCGEYCVYFLAKRTKGYSFQSIIDEFDKYNLKGNDSFVKQFIDDIIVVDDKLVRNAHKNTLSTSV